MKISVITICKNSERTIEDTIKSVIYQNYDELEYIIVDGDSTDGTLSIIDKYKEKIANVISEQDNGISDAFNKGVRLATGDVIGIINSDDMYYKGALECVAKTFAEDSSLEVFFGNVLYFEENATTGVLTYSNSNLNHLKANFEIMHPSVFVKKSAYEKYGVFNCSYRVAMDYELLSRMYYNGAKFKYVNQVISCFRHGGFSEASSKKTLAEHRKIARNNGASEFKIAKVMFIDKYSVWALRKVLIKIGVIGLARKFIHHDSFEIYWW